MRECCPRPAVLSPRLYVVSVPALRIEPRTLAHRRDRAEGTGRRAGARRAARATFFLFRHESAWLAEVIRPMAAPVLGGLLIADEVIDVFLPVLYFAVKKQQWRKLHQEPRNSRSSASITTARPWVATIAGSTAPASQTNALETAQPKE